MQQPPWLTAEKLTQYCDEALAEAKERSKQLKDGGARDLEGTLLPYNEMSKLLDTAMGWSSLMFAVHPDKEVRSAAEACKQKLAELDNEMKLDRALYDAVASVETEALDPQARRLVWQIVEEFKEGGGTVLLTTHYMDEAERLSDQLVIMDHGKTIAEGPPDQIIDGLNADAVLEFRTEGEQDEELFAGLPGVISVRRVGGTVTMGVTDQQTALFSLLERTRERDVPVDDLRTHRPTLEDVFVSLTGRHIRDG